MRGICGEMHEAASRGHGEVPGVRCIKLMMQPFSCVEISNLIILAEYRCADLGQTQPKITSPA